MTWALSILLLGLYIYICVRSVRKGLLVLVASLPLYLVRLSIGPIPTTLLELMLVVIIAVWALGFLNEPRRESFLLLIHEHCWLAIGVLLLWIGALLGLTQSYDVAGSLNIIKTYLIEPVVLLVLFWSVGRSSENFRVSHVLVALAVPLGLVGAVATFQALTGLTIPSAWLYEGRATSIFPYPNAVSHLVAPLLTVLIAVFVSGKARLNHVQRQGMTVAMIFGALAVLFAQTEAAVAAILVSLFVVSFNYRLGPRRTIPFAIVVVALLFLIPSLRHTAIQKFTLQDWSGQTRTAQWQETWQYLSSSPAHFVLGAGPNNYPQAIAPYHTHDYLEIFQYPHNIVLNIWVETGLLGLAGFGLIAYEVLKVAWRHRRQHFVAPIFAGLLTMTIHGLVDVPYFKNDLSMLTWTLIALLLIAAHTERVWLVHD